MNGIFFFFMKYSNCCWYIEIWLNFVYWFFMFIHVAKFSLLENDGNNFFRDFPINYDNVLIKVIIVFPLLNASTWPP